MNTELSFHQKQMQNEFRFFASKEIIPFADQYDEQQQFPPNLIAKFAKSGYLGAMISKKYGGMEMDAITFGLLCEEMGKASVSLISLLTVHGMVSHAILRWGEDNQKDKWLVKLSSGEILAAFGLSEPDAGSDPSSLETTIKNEGNFFVLNGRKKWISCAQIADIFLIFARCDEQISAILVEKNTPGLFCKPISGMLGFRSAMLGELFFDNCRVPKENLIGRIGTGFKYVANSALDYGRYCVAWGCVGLGQACLDACLEYTCTRKQGGVLIRKHQLIQKMIADMVTEVKAARMLCLHAGCLKEIADPGSIMETNVAKYFASKMANKVASDAIQIHGANGCCNSYPVQRYFRDAKITEIIEGSSQIQQIIISQYGYQNYLFKSKITRK
ncbi:MAG: acyl-CoA dehydrogenase family protein [Gammaproteobacteria bacterium]|nr:acyl-CoA dehydrogenase family protein [Gammaproteobacteria bacterium]